MPRIVVYLVDDDGQTIDELVTMSEMQKMLGTAETNMAAFCKYNGVERFYLSQKCALAKRKQIESLVDREGRRKRKYRPKPKTEPGVPVPRRAGARKPGEK